MAVKIKGSKAPGAALKKKVAAAAPRSKPAVATPKTEPIPAASTRLRDIEVEEFLAESVNVSPERIDDEFRHVPAALAYWNERYAVALRAFLECKIERERIAGELTCDPEVLESCEARIGKKPTVEHIKNWVAQHERHVSARLREAAAEAEKYRLRGCIDAVAAKRDMLISLGAHLRIEMMHDPMIRKSMAEAREFRAQGE